MVNTRTMPHLHLIISHVPNHRKHGDARNNEEEEEKDEEFPRQPFLPEKALLVSDERLPASTTLLGFLFSLSLLGHVLQLIGSPLGTQCGNGHQLDGPIMT